MFAFSGNESRLQLVRASLYYSYIAVLYHKSHVFSKGSEVQFLLQTSINDLNVDFASHRRLYTNATARNTSSPTHDPLHSILPAFPSNGASVDFEIPPDPVAATLATAVPLASASCTPTTMKKLAASGAAKPASAMNALISNPMRELTALL
jgi:hypothetical protein